MIFALTGIGVAILKHVEAGQSFTEFPFSTYSISFLADDIFRLRHVREQAVSLFPTVRLSSARIVLGEWRFSAT
jgi:circadian clock protein KaiC